MSQSHDLQFVAELARGAGKVILEYFGQTERLTKTHQAAKSEAVTVADRASQRFIVAGLKKRFPGDGIVGEENDTGSDITAEIPDPNGRVWIIDPLDGTNNFVAHFPTFAVCIGLLEKGYPVLGIVYDVCRDTMYAAARGEGAWIGPKRLAAHNTPLGDASILMLTSNLLNKQGRAPGYAIRWLSQTNWKIRIMGSAALEACQVGAGIAHGALTIHGKIWDAAAAAAVVLEAGGKFTDLAGKDIFPFNLAGYSGAKVPFLCAGPAAHALLLNEIMGNP
jgi:myo-inositol-1(or 4)-monophosphatase